MEELKDIHSHITKTTIKNKVFRSGTIVVCVTVGSDPYIILDQGILEPKSDSSDKDEGETTCAKRLINNLYKEYHHFADIIVADALFCKSTWIKEVLSIGMNAVVKIELEKKKA